MQDKYVGDIGDYIKYALLRVIMKAEPKKTLGVAWYRHEDKSANNDGGKIGYLHEPKKWRALDKDVFDVLHDLVCVRDERSVSAIEKSKILGERTEFFSEKVPPKKQRQDWFSRLEKNLRDCQIIFADPDNGLCEDKRISPKHITLSEVKALAKNRVGIFYHSFSYAKEYDEQTKDWCKKLKVELGVSVMTLKWNMLSPRVFFIVNPTSPIKKALKAMPSRLSLKNTNGKPALVVKD